MPDQEDISGRNGGNPEPRPEQEQPTEISGTVTVRLRNIANLLTAVVAVAAILLSVWEGIENRRHSRLSVLPHLKPIEATYGSATPIDNKYSSCLPTLTACMLWATRWRIPGWDQRSWTIF